MAQGRRTERVAALIRKETSELLLNGIRDERLHQGIISITEVIVSGDLQHCKIYVSIFDVKNDHIEIIRALNCASGFVRRELGQRLKMRRAPEVLFELDRGLEKGTKILGLLNQLEISRKENAQDIESENGSSK